MPEYEAPLQPKKRNSSDQDTTKKQEDSTFQLKDNRTTTGNPPVQGKFKPDVIQRMFGGYSFGADTGADNAGEFYLEDQRRQARERAAEERRQREAREAKIAAVWSEFGQSKYLLSGNATPVQQMIEAAILRGLPTDKSASKIVSDIIAEYFGNTSGSYAADREQYGGEKGKLRR